MLHTTPAKYALAAMSALDIAVFLCFGIIASIIVAIWLGD